MVNGLGLSTNSSVPFTAKGKREFVPRGQVFPITRSLPFITSPET